MIRAISGHASAAMLLVAAAALVNLGIAFLPLADLHALHHPGRESAALAITLRAGGWVLLAGCCLGAAAAWAGWLVRARANLVAFGVRSRRVVDSVGRAPEVRRRMTVFTWAFRGTLLAGAATLPVASLAGRETAAEMGGVRAQARAGQPVDDALAAHLFGRELVLYLPAAALFVLAAAFALLLIAHITSAQYGRVARLRARDSAVASEAVDGTIRA
ncbi:hypothetical protein ACPPVO_56375 [Dactylosporangium sp. McL0621]|uniref:hypothetical protein n=1 Tax=Dactylosporangium sp. McL0621 TaxID=3415678 RepID=UPI003CEE1648